MLAPRTVTWLVLFVVHFASGAQDVDEGSSAPVGDVRNCPTTSPIFPKDPLYRMEVLPGAGFDALRSVDMGQVHAYNYSQCRVSNDGRYLLPDNVFLIPTMKSHVQVFAEFIDHWSNYTSTTSTTITLEAGFESIISGKFSDEYLSVKSHMYNDESYATRVQIRNTLFKVKIQPDSQLHPTFRSRLFEIAANIQNNNTEFAHYLAELTVREYGTHFITSMDAGAVLAQIDHIKSTAFEEKDFTKNTVTASASANFFGKFSFSSTFSHSTSHSEDQRFVDNRTYSEVYSWGGPPFGPNMTVNDWENGVPNSMVAVDRSGDPLHYAITPTSLPEMPEGTVFEVANMIFRAISRYYKVNTRHGCTDVNSQNFDFQANVDDHSCKPPSTNFTFGGVYQTCTYAIPAYEDLCTGGPEPVQQLNPLTGDTSCREPYMSVLLHSGQYRHTVRRQVCQKHCSWWHCHQNCYLQPYTTIVNYEAYWCVAPGHVGENSGYLFGGYFTSTAANPFLGSKSCPRHYIPLHFGEDMKICVSDDYELGYPYSVPFAGFDSCQVGNPLAVTNPSLDNQASWPHACPIGFSQHLVAVDENCEINFCIISGAFNRQKTIPPRLPPFRKRKQMNPNATDTMVVIGNYGDIWYRAENGDWVRDNSGDIQSGKSLMALVETDIEPAEPVPLKRSSSSSDSLSRGAVAGISVAATIGLCTLIVVVVFAGFSIVRKKRRGFMKKGEDTYLSINEESASNPHESNI
jgi:hypothetical protein